MGAVAIQESESLNDSFGFERDLWQRKTGQSSHVPKTSVFERLSSVKNAYWILLYAAKKLFLYLNVTTRIGHAVFTAASKIRDYNQI